jgi:hypothetical protein
MGTEPQIFRSGCPGASSQVELSTWAIRVVPVPVPDSSRGGEGVSERSVSSSVVAAPWLACRSVRRSAARALEVWAKSDARPRGLCRGCSDTGLTQLKARFFVNALAVRRVRSVALARRRAVPHVAPEVPPRSLVKQS